MTLPPTPPHVIQPNGTRYIDVIEINYSEALPYSTATISYYNITLVNTDLTWNYTIKSNNSLNLSYVWNSTEVIDGTYRIKVEAVDSNGLKSQDYSTEFTIDNVVIYVLEIVTFGMEWVKINWTTY